MAQTRKRKACTDLRVLAEELGVAKPPNPCYSLLAKTQEKKEEQMIAAMGTHKWVSEKSKRKGSNLRAPATANSQASFSVRVDWTPVFARGKLRIYVVDPDKADAFQPVKLADADNLGKFIRNVLPLLLQDMKAAYGWNDLPRTVVHDKASYMVTSSHERLHVTFASALSQAGFRSWIGEPHDTTKWLVKKFGDVYLHETVIAHIRRLLATDFVCKRLAETPAQIKVRMKSRRLHEL